MSFFKTGEQEIETGPIWGCYQWEGRGYEERVWEHEYGRNIMYTCKKMKKMRPVETIPGMEGGG
jgi:biotin-(acetyl-CoA carboxylase) ligase